MGGEPGRPILPQCGQAADGPVRPRQSPCRERGPEHHVRRVTGQDRLKVVGVPLLGPRPRVRSSARVFAKAAAPGMPRVMWNTVAAASAAPNQEPTVRRRPGEAGKQLPI